MVRRHSPAGAVPMVRTALAGTMELGTTMVRARHPQMTRGKKTVVAGGRRSRVQALGEARAASAVGAVSGVAVPEEEEAAEHVSSAIRKDI